MGEGCGRGEERREGIGVRGEDVHTSKKSEFFGQIPTNPRMVFVEYRFLARLLAATEKN